MQHGSASILTVLGLVLDCVNEATANSSSNNFVGVEVEICDSSGRTMRGVAKMNMTTTAGYIGEVEINEVFHEGNVSTF
jgi:small ligand-binding sensory domain FIST